MDEIGCNSIYKIPYALENLGLGALICTKDKYTRYWYKKSQGQKLKNTRKLHELETILPGCSRLLFHPLWQLLSKTNHSQQQLIEIASQFPPELSNRVLKIQGGVIAFRKLRKDICYENTLDALTIMMLQRLHDKNISIEKLHYNSVETSKLLLRLLALRYQFPLEGKLYVLLNRYFESLGTSYTAPFLFKPLWNNEQTLRYSFGSNLSEAQANQIIASWRAILRTFHKEFCFETNAEALTFFSYMSFRFIGVFLNEKDLKKPIFEKTFTLALYHYCQTNAKKCPFIQSLDYVDLWVSKRNQLPKQLDFHESVLEVITNELIRTKKLIMMNRKEIVSKINDKLLNQLIEQTNQLTFDF